MPPDDARSAVQVRPVPPLLCLVRVTRLRQQRTGASLVSTLHSFVEEESVVAMPKRRGVRLAKPDLSGVSSPTVTSKNFETARDGASRNNESAYQPCPSCLPAL